MIESKEKTIKKEVRVLRKDVYSSPQKSLLVADLIRGKSFKDAVNILLTTNKKVCVEFLKCLKTAKANLESKYKMINENKLIVTGVEVCEGKKVRKYVFGAKGRFDKGNRRYSNIYITLTQVA